MPRWTAEQTTAIETRGHSLLVAAAAGSGKTAVLVERIVRLVSDAARPLDLDRLLVVTFTNAAAMEMKERIGAAIQKQLAENPCSEHLYRQSLLLQKAQITTLHAFCLDLVRQNFFRLDLDPQRKIADETEAQLLLSDALDEVLEDYYSDETRAAEFFPLVDAYGGREDETLRDGLLRIYRMAQSMPQPERWLASLTAPAKVDWFAEEQREVERSLRYVRDRLVLAINAANTDKGLARYLPVLEEDYNWICELLACLREGGWDSLPAKLDRGFGRLPAVRGDACDERVKARVTGCRDDAKAELAKLRRDYFSRSREDALRDLEEQAPVRALLVELVQALSERFRQKKAQRGLMDFSDMEHYCYQLLYETPETADAAAEKAETAAPPPRSALARELQARYAEVMVDEYQDINDLQEGILQAVSRSDNLFMVGDVKQSIYGFRLANPRLFAEKYRRFPPLAEAPAESPCLRIDLNRNFRCRAGVVQGVNQVFARLMDGQDGDLLYDDAASLVYGADYPPVPEGTPPVPERISLSVLTGGPQEDAETGESLSLLEAEGRLLCRKISALMEEGAQVYDTHAQCYRALTWRDVVVLLRSPKQAGPIYDRMLKEAGIPAAVDLGDGYFSAWEIRIVVDLLHVLDNPLQDIPLLAVLKAPFFAFTDDELARLRLLAPEGCIYEALERAAEEPEEASPEDLADAPLRQRAAECLGALRRWRALTRQLDLSKLIWQLYKDTGFYEYCGALLDGTQRQANLRALHERARAYEKTSFHGVFMFLRFLEQLEERGADLEPARVLSDSENVVRIMSIHKSKGLEFPVVFVGGLGRSFNLRDTQEEFLLDKELGLAFSVVDTELSVKYRTVAQRVIARRRRLELLQEEERLLYVAMTRARERLYLLGGCADAEQKREIPPDRAQCCLDWLLPLPLAEPLWQVELLPMEEQSASAAAADAETSLAELLRRGEPLPASAYWQNAIARQLGWQYEKPDFIAVKAQFSVTELRQRTAGSGGAGAPEFRFDSRPQAVKAKTGLSSAERGTLLHLILSRVDLHAEIDAAYLEQLVARLETEQFIASGAADGLELGGVLAFFRSSLGQRLLAADEDKRYRERPFIAALDAHALDAALPAGEKNVLVQGVIDCLWQEADGGWVLVDYKSDRIEHGRTEVILERYSGQMRLYRYAVEAILGERVKECYFYLLRSGEVVPVRAEESGAGEDAKGDMRCSGIPNGGNRRKNT